MCNMKTEFKHFQIAIKRLYQNILGFEEGTDIDATIEGIQKDIAFRGHTAWILIFSILIASIGLNVNSTAVIIGAMLISPLMGPILGIGLSIGTNDYDTLIRSLKNIGIAISISLITSTLYFMVTPLDIEQSELLARTKPTFLDVLIALLGGLAGIIAGSRKEKSNVIPGVAIATALMPPLCTAGYGLANLKFEYFFGAFYLFFINSVFISLSTFLIVRYLKFPVKEYVNSEKMKKYRTILIAFLILTVTPSVIIFFNVIQEARFNVIADNFIKQHASVEGSELISSKIEYSDTLSVVNLYYIGDEIDKNVVQNMDYKFKQLFDENKSVIPLTKVAKIKVHQGSNNDIDIESKMTEFKNDLRIKVIEDLYNRNEEVIRNKDQKITFLEQEVVRLSKKDTLPLTHLSKEIKYHFPDIGKFAYSKTVEVYTVNDTIYYDTVPVFLIEFTKQYKYSHRKQVISKAQNWLKVRFDNEKIKVVEY